MVFTLYRPGPVCLFTPTRFTLPGAPGDSSVVYLGITQIHQHEHGGKGGRFTWWTECRAHGSDKNPVGSRWGCCCVCLPVNRPSSAETRLALISQPTGVFSQHLSGTRKDQACWNHGTVLKIIMTAAKRVNTTQNQREKGGLLWEKCGERNLTLHFYHSRRLQEPTSLHFRGPTSRDTMS